MDFISLVWAASLVLFVAGPGLAGIAYHKGKITFAQALIAGLLAFTISAALSWSLVVFI